MQHFLLFTIVLTAITFVSLFWASSQDGDSVITSESQSPQEDSMSTNFTTQQRKASDSNSSNQPGSSVHFAATPMPGLA